MDAPLDRDAVQELCQEVRRLSAENEDLRQQVSHLQSQLNLLSGKTLNPELARSWLPGLKRCKGWSQLVIGKSRWVSEGGEGLRGLISDLLIKANPDADNNRLVWTLRTKATLQSKGQPQLADALTKLTRGLSGRLPLVIEASLLIYGDQAVEMLSTKPADVVQKLATEVQRVNAVAGEAKRRYLFELIKARASDPQARQVLGVGADATADEIKQAYRQLARQHHPDAGGDAERFHQIQQAYEALQQPAAVTV